MAGLIRDFDWSRTLGPIERWPASLKTTVGLLVSSPIAMVLLWGPDGIMIYNDAYARFAGRRHPQILGAKVLEAWAEVADFNANIMKVVMGGGTLTYHDRELVLDRRGKMEQGWMDLGYSPVIAEDGRPGGVIAIVVETTERVLAQKRVASERDRLAQMFAQAPGFMALLEGPEHRFRLSNPGYDRLVGGRPLLGRTVAEALPEVVTQGFVTTLDQVYNSGQPFSALGSKVVLRDAVTGRADDFFLDFVYQPLTDEHGQTSGVFVQGVDVTERVRAEQRRELLSGLSDALSVTQDADQILALTTRMTGEYMKVSVCAYADMDDDEDGFYIRGDWAAPGSTSIVGRYRLADFGALAVQRLHAGLPLVINDNLREISPNEAATFQAIGLSATICMPLVKRGRLKALMAIHDKQPRIWTEAELALIREVTERSWAHVERVAAQAEMRASEENFRTLALVLPSQVWTASADGTLDWFNDTVYSYSGATQGELDGHGWTAIVHPQDVEASQVRWAEALAQGCAYEAEFRLRRHDNTYRWHLARAVPLVEQGRVVRWLGANTDVQDQKETQAVLSDLNAMLEEKVQERTRRLLETEEALRQAQKMEAVGQLTGGLAHDFNNLLAAIGGSVALIKRQLPADSQRLLRYVDTAEGAVRRAASLTHRLLAFSRRQALDPKPTDCNRLISGMEELIRRSVGPDVAVTVAAATDLAITRVDPPQLESALLNLCINARDAMAPNGGQLTIATANVFLDERMAREHDLQPGHYVSLCVADTGSGMAPDVIQRAFDPFFTTKPIGQGTGLGLSMVYGFVRQSGGQVHIESQVGQGTRLCLFLPQLAQDVEEPMPGPVAEKDEAGRGETIVLIDDEPDVRMLVSEVLREAGYAVLEAATGAEGLQLMGPSQRVDLLITDVGLPGGMNGRQVADAARTGRPHLKVLFITGYAESAAIGDGQLAPGMDLLTKPFDLTAFGAKVRAILNRN